MAANLAARTPSVSDLNIGENLFRTVNISGIGVSTDSTLCVSLWSGTSGRAKNKQRGPHILSDASACAGTGTRSSSDGFPLAECHRAFPKKEVPPVIRLDTSQEEDDWVALVHTTPGTGQEEPPLP